MVHFVGAGPGAPDLITLRGAERLKKADVVIYAGSLVNPVLLGLCSAQCRIFNSAEMTLEQVLSTMEQAEREMKKETLENWNPGRVFDSEIREEIQRRCVCIRGTPASMGRSRNRWMR